MYKLKGIINSKRYIKSLYNFEKIFSFLDQRQKLNIIIYNKGMQKLLGINIEDYKKISQKYKLGKRNGKGREYVKNSNTLIFEGEYLNGKRNGKGQEYYNNGKLKFEGEYNNGKRNGEGKEYYNNGKLKFEGEYNNGKRNGKGQEYYNNGKLKFEGEYKNGERLNGKGYNKNGIMDFQIKNGSGNVKQYYNDDKLKFEGEYLNGKRNGKGKEYIWNVVLP